MTKNLKRKDRRLKIKELNMLDKDLNMVQKVFLMDFQKESQDWSLNLSKEQRKMDYQVSSLVDLKGLLDLLLNQFQV